MTLSDPCATTRRDSDPIAADFFEGDDASPRSTATASPDEPVASALPKIGERLRERFVLLRELGAGRSGVVFLARDDETGHEVAIKVLRRHGTLVRLKCEYRRLRGLLHPHVVSARELFAERTPAFLVMPHVRGRHLDQVITDAPAPARAALARRCLAQLALALDALHRAGFVHRDVKPSNVLVSSDGFVQLIDFGLVASSHAKGATLEGTPAYIAPEVIEEGIATPASDWYSFGTVLHQALSGTLPFSGSVDEVLRRKCVEDAPALASEIRAADPDLAALTASLLSRAPSERPSPRRVLEVLGVESPADVPDFERFFGRDRELSYLAEVYATVAEGGARAVEIVGPSGIGKTSLSRRFVARLASSDEPPLVFSSVCYENEHGAFNALDEAMATLLRTDETPEYASGEPVHSEEREPTSGVGRSLGGAFAESLRRASRDRPVVIVIDQLQWADADSARVLAEAWPLLEGARVLMLLLVRDDQRDGSGFVRHVEAHLPAILETKLVLGPLDDAACDALVRNLTSDGAAPRFDSARGNPMVLSWMASGDRSLRALDADCRELGAWIALAGHPVAMETLERAVRAVRDVRGAAQRLEAERWIGTKLHRGTTMLAPAHDWTRAQLVRDVDGARAREVHISLARSLASSATSSPEEVGEHYYRAGAHRELLPYALRAARRSHESRAFSNEALWLERVLESPENLPIERAALRRRAAEARGKGGWGRESAVHYLQLAEGPARERAAELRLLAAEQLFRSGDWHAAHLELGATLGHLGIRLPRSRASMLAALLWTRARLRMQRFDVPTRPDEELSELTVLRLRAYEVGTLAHMALEPLTGAYCASRHLLLALRERAGDHMLRALADELALLTGASPDANRVIERIVDMIGARLPSARRREDRLYAEMMLGTVPLLTGDFATASAMFTRSEHDLRADAPHLTWELTLCRMLLLTAEMFHRGLGESAGSLDAWIEDARRRRDDAALRYFVIKRVMTHLAHDDPVGARQCAREAERAMLASERPVDMDRATLLNVRVYLHLYAGEAVDGLALSAALRRVMRSSVGRVRGLFTTAVALDAGLLLGQPSAGHLGCVDRRLRRAERALLADGADYARGYARAIAAARAHRDGRRSAAAALLDEAALAFEKAGMRPACASARARLGQILGHDEGRRMRDAALAELASLGIRRPERYLRLHTPGFDVPAPLEHASLAT